MEPPTTRRVRRAALALLCAVALVSGCGGDDPEAEPADDSTTTLVPAAPDTTDPDQDEEAEDVVIVISDFAYEVPGTIAAGAEVTVTNEDAVGHTVTSDEDGVFDVAVGPGETVTFTAPEEPGEYGFFCIPHPQMTDTLVVG